MFFADQTAAFANVFRTVRPGGRLALASWQGIDQNEWIRELRDALAAGRDLPAPPPDAPSPFRHADPEAVRGILTGAGFQDIQLEDVHVPIFQGGNVEAGFAVITALFEWMFEGLDDAQRAGAKDALRAAMKRHETADGVVFDSAIWLISATRP